ncbi:TonB-dependent receptor [Prevotella sp. 10(H)]|uniref:SusC/RagA family TonB-linked outer membrane protein n=1 Tax=Prevotella sp. 10(H) TaxID=1158294 RepID=UPI0004A6AF3D|nr:TonB-dependent receptor [Prevotella sp. 10(H)]
MKKYILIILCLSIYALNAHSQTAKVEVTGRVTDVADEPLIGASVSVKNTVGLGVITDADGKFKITVNAYSQLVITYIGFVKQEVQIKDTNTELKIVLKEDVSNVIEEVTITGTGPQKKATLTGAISTVDVGLLKTSSSSITNALAGNVAGVLAMQTSGQPGQNTSEFWVRGISTFGAGSSALVLVDGFERNLNEINVEDIESFSVLKDASTTAIYGSRGANGVILVTTKRGRSGKISVNAKAEVSYSSRTFTPEFVDGHTYALLLNEARTTRNLQPSFSNQELDLYRSGLDADLYPNVDWLDLLLKDGAPTYRANIDLSGGGETARYFVSTSYVDEGGMFRADNAVKDYKTNTNYSRWNYRLNLDIDITKSTLLKVGVSGALERQNQPGFSQDDIWHSALGQNPIAIPIKYSNGYFPSYGEGVRTNPWVMSTQSGYNESWKNTIQTNAVLEQNLGFITQGLKFTGRFGFDTFNDNNIQRRKIPELWKASRRRNSAGEIDFTRVMAEMLMSQSSGSNGSRRTNFEAELNYDRAFNTDHRVGTTIKYTQGANKNTANVGDDIRAGIEKRNQTLAGRFTYSWKSRYLFDFNFGYNGSENFAKGHQFGFFPAFSVAWNVAEEDFIKKKFDWLTMFKIRYSYGEVGNDNITDSNNRFPYFSSFVSKAYNKDADNGKERWKDGYNWGDIDSPYPFSDLTYSIISSKDVTWEKSKKHDVGLDVYIFNDKFNLTVDYFYEKRTGIYMDRNYIPAIVGLQGTVPKANLGSTLLKGFDGNFAVHHTIDKVKLALRGNFTYSKNEIREADEQYSNYPYTMRAGYRINQNRGLIAEGLFKDYEDIRDSPTQTFGDVMPGDIKYKDVNGDGKIDDNDVVPIGSTAKPNLIYGLGLAVEWNNFDFNILFQGAGKSSFFIDGFTVYPFSSGDWGNILTDVVKSNRWILGENEDVNAEYPRLSFNGNANNYRSSTYWLRDGKYLRLKNLEIGYRLPNKITNKIMLKDARLYFMATNLLTFSKFKLWDPELGSSNGQRYPLSRTFTLGLTINI